MIITIGILSLLCLVLLIAFLYALNELLEASTMVDCCKQDYSDLSEKYQHLLVQLGNHGFEIDMVMRTACFIKLNGSKGE